jgi:hypothetical protein
MVMDANDKEQFRRVESNMGTMKEDINRRLAVMDGYNEKRFAVVDANSKEQFGRGESIMDEMIEDFNKRFDVMDANFKERFDAADTKFDKLDKKVDVLLFLSISLLVLVTITSADVRSFLSTMFQFIKFSSL